MVGLAGALLLWTVYCWFIPEPGPNELSRVDLTYALARRAQTAIDPYAANTIDRAEHDGRYYSDKPLGLPLLAAPVLKAADRLLRLGDLGETRVSYVAHLLTAATVALPAALLAPLVALVAYRLGAAAASAIAAAAAMALGTALLPFATTFYAHATSTALGFLGFALGTGLLLARRPRAAAVLAGGAAGLAALVEYPVMLIGAVVLGLRLARRQPVGLYLVGGAVALAPLPLYNWLSFGAPWRLGYSYVSQAAFGGMSAGFFGLSRPRLEALAEIALGPAGLISQSPWLLGAPIGLALLWRGGAAGPALAAATVALLFVLYNASYYLPLGGQSSGPRFLLPIVPFLALGLAFLPGASWLLLGPLAAASFGQMIAIAAVEPKTGPGHPDPFWDYWLPRVVVGDVALSWAEVKFGLRGVATLVPLALPLALGAIVAIAAARPRWGTGTRGAALILTLAAASWVVLVAPIGPRGVPDRFRARALEPAHQVGVVYGEAVELVGYRAPGEVAPGQVLDLTLYWRARAPVEQNLTAFVHAVGRDGANLGGFDGPPLGAGFPTNLWPTDVMLQAPYRLRIDPAAGAPTGLRVVVGLYEPGNRLLPARDPAGQAIDPGPAVLRLALRDPSRAVSDEPARARFEAELDLLDWTLPPAIRPGAPATGTLRWRARSQPPRDATVFVQAIGPGGPIAQWDAQPLEGAYPTSLWPAGEVVVDRFRLTLGPGVAAGEYPLIAGLYLLPEVRRLGVESGGDHVLLGRLRVEP